MEYRTNDQRSMGPTLIRYLGEGRVGVLYVLRVTPSCAVGAGRKSCVSVICCRILQPGLCSGAARSASGVAVWGVHMPQVGPPTDPVGGAQQRSTS